MAEQRESALSGLIAILVEWIERDEEFIANQARLGWRSYRIGADNVQVDTTDDDLRGARERIENYRRMIEAWERRNSGTEVNNG